MLSNLRNKRVAGWTATALAASSLAVAPMLAGPALANSGTVELAPSVGTNYGAFSDDAFTMEAKINLPLDTGTFAYSITVDDVEKIDFVLRDAAADTSDTGISEITILGVDALGQVVDLDGLDTTAHTDSGGDFQTDKLAQVVLTSGAFTFDFTNDTGTDVKTIHIHKADGQTSRVQTIEMTPKTAGGADIEYGDGSPGSVTVQAWVETEAKADYTTIESNASPARTVNFYDPATVAVLPSVKRFVDANDTVILNDSGADFLGAALRFGQTDLNLDQVDITDWNYKIGNSNDTDFDNIAADGALSDTETVLRKGFTKFDDQGEITMKLRNENDSDLDLASSDDYIVSIKDNDTDGVYAASPAFSPASGSTTVDEIAVDVISTGNVNQTDEYDTEVDARAGTESLTFRAQIQTDADTAIKAPSVLVLAVVESGSFMSTGAVLSVTGSSETITKKDRRIIASGFTNSSGQIDFTVTNSGATKDDDYSVQFYALNGADDKFIEVNKGSRNANYDVDYQASSASELKVDNNVLGGESVTLNFTVEDQFGQATNLEAGKALSVHVTASDTSKLDEDVVVAADGTASVTFNNYAALGAADVITAAAYTGSTSNRSKTGGNMTKVVTLYNAEAAAAVQVPETVTGEITYNDFIPNGEKATTTNPDPDNDITVTGTIVDTSGSGVPGAAVTISAPGMQIQESGSSLFYQDEHTVTASAAGVFTVNLNAHTVNTAGTDVTFTTPGGVVGTTSVKTYLPDTGVTGDVLDFSVDLPSELVMNTTYAVTASLKDKWGNPIRTAGTDAGVTFSGAGSFQVNGVTTDIEKQFDANGEALVYVRSVKDVAGPGTFTATLDTATYTSFDDSTGQSKQVELEVDENTTDVTTTVWDETVFTNSFAQTLLVVESATASTTQKVNAGSFKGYVAVYALGYEGQRLSAKIGKDWVIVDPIVNNQSANLARVTDFTGAGVDIQVRIYIDRVLVDTIPLTTK